MTNEVFIGLTFNEMMEVKDAIRNQTQENKHAIYTKNYENN